MFLNDVWAVLYLVFGAMWLVGSVALLIAWAKKDR